VLRSRDVFSAIVGQLTGAVAMDLENDDDAELIVALYNAAPALLDRLERQAAAIEAVQEARRYAVHEREISSFPLSFGYGDMADRLGDALDHLSGITPTTEENR
jgi:hypothetical protein